MSRSSVGRRRGGTRTKQKPKRRTQRSSTEIVRGNMPLKALLSAFRRVLRNNQANKETIVKIVSRILRRAKCPVSGTTLVFLEHDMLGASTAAAAASSDP